MEKTVTEAISKRRSRRMSAAIAGAAVVFIAAVAWEHYRSQSQAETENVTLHPFGKGPQRPQNVQVPAYATSAPMQEASAPLARKSADTTTQPMESDGPAPPLAISGAFRLQEASALMLAMGPNMMSGQRAQQSLLLLLDQSPPLARLPRRQRMDVDTLAQLHTRTGRGERMVELLHDNLGAEQVRRSRKFFADEAVQQFLVRLDETTTLKQADVQRLVEQVGRMSDWRQRALWEIAKTTHIWEVENHMAAVVGPAIMQILALPPLAAQTRQGLARDISIARAAHATAALDDNRLWDLAQRLARADVTTPFDWAAQAFVSELPSIVLGFRERYAAAR